MTTFAEKAEKEYDAVLTSGMFFEFFPTLCGDWEKDKTEFLERFYTIEMCRGNIDEYFAQQIVDGKSLEDVYLTPDSSRIETAEEHLANNIDGLTDFIENDDKVSSNFIGVRYVPKYNYWKAYIKIEKEEFLLGVFEDEMEAKKTYEKTLSDWENRGIKPVQNNRSRFSSKFKGVYFNNKLGKWTAQFFIKGASFHVGNFNTEIEAKNAYEKVQKEYKQTGIFPTKKYASKYKFINYLRGKWQANALNVDGVKKKYLGIFKTEEDAAEKVREYLGLNSTDEILR